MSLEFLRDIGPRYAVGQDVMSSLYVERLLDLRKGSDIEMEKY